MSTKRVEEVLSLEGSVQVGQVDFSAHPFTEDKMREYYQGEFSRVIENLTEENQLVLWQANIAERIARSVIATVPFTNQEASYQAITSGIIQNMGNTAIGEPQIAGLVVVNFLKRRNEKIMDLTELMPSEELYLKAA